MSSPQCMLGTRVYRHSESFRGVVLTGLVRSTLVSVSYAPGSVGVGLRGRLVQLRAERAGCMDPV